MPDQGYLDPNEISDEAVVEAFRAANEVIFFARNFNYVKYRGVGVGKIGWLPLERLFQVLGIKPQDLKGVFDSRKGIVKRRFPFNFSFLGLNKRTRKFGLVELPDTIPSYDDLGAFPLDENRFVELAKILQKPIRVLREDGSSGDAWELFMAYPFGKVVELDGN